MGRVLAVVGLLGLLSFVGCAPTVSGELLGDVDIRKAVRESSGVYTPPRGIYEPVPSVSEERLADPDSRVRQIAFDSLRRVAMEGRGPEVEYLYGVYYKAEGRYLDAARAFNRGMRGLYPFAFDRQGRDVWRYGFGRAESYLLAGEYARALLDAEALVEVAPPRRGTGISPRAEALELLAKAAYGAGEYRKVKEAVREFLVEVSERAPVYAPARTYRMILLGAKADEALGDKESALRTYASLAEGNRVDVPPDVAREAREGVERLRPSVPSTAVSPSTPPSVSPSTPPSSAGGQASDEFAERVRTLVGELFRALQALEFRRVGELLTTPPYDALQEERLKARVTPEVRSKAEALVYRVVRVVPSSPTNPLPLVEVVYTLPDGEEGILRLSVVEAGGSLRVLSGSLPPMLQSFLGTVDSEAFLKFLRAFHRAIGLPLE